MKNTKLLVSVLGACVTAGVVSVLAGTFLRSPTRPTQATMQDSMAGGMMADDKAMGSTQAEEKMAMEPGMMSAPKTSTSNGMMGEAMHASSNRKNEPKMVGDNDRKM